MLWYREAVTENDLARLQSITGVYRSQLIDGPAGEYWAKLMCWPQRVVRHEARVGIVVPAYDDRFRFEHGSQNGDALKLRGREKEGYWFASLQHRTRSLDPRELGDWRTALRMAVRVARGVRRLHAAGLVHGDLSYKNVLLDPTRGDVCLIDLDGLVVPGKYPPDVLGTRDFIAPEVVATSHLHRDDPRRCLPDWRSDLHALAVLIYQLLLLRHPLRGDQIHDLDDDDRQEAMLMGSHALFIEDAARPVNRIRPELTEAYERPWKLTEQLPYTALGTHLSSLVRRAFEHGLHDPAQRPSAQEWEDALVATADLLHPCAASHCSAKWFVYEPRRHACPFCNTALPAPPVAPPVLIAHLYRDRGNGSFAPVGKHRVLHHHAPVHAWHTNTDFAPNEHLSTEHHARLGYIGAHGAELYLVNEAFPQVRDLSTGTPASPGEAIALERGKQLLFGNEAPAHLWWIDEFASS